MENEKGLSLVDMYNDSKGISKYAKDVNVQLLLNRPVPMSIIKEHPYAKGSDGKPLKYISIEFVEWLLSYTFPKWWAEVITYNIIANSVCVHVRLFVHFPDGDGGYTVSHQDGLGASPIQTNKGASATDFTAVKTAAIQMALPSAESYAIKDAAKKFGKVFGRGLNREQADYNIIETRNNQIVLESITSMTDFEIKCDGCEKVSDVHSLWDRLKHNQQMNTKYKSIYDNALKRIEHG